MVRGVTDLALSGIFVDGPNRRQWTIRWLAQR
jgi:hypothetical protein